MSSSRGRRFFEPAVKRPPPEHGIRMKKAGTTWWGQRWLGALEQVLSGDAGRLARGRTYARAGRTHDLVVRGGAVHAKVTGSRPRPYDVAIQIAELSDKVWRQALSAMARRAQFAAELLAGTMPEAIDEAFQEAQSSLFPRRRSELKATCSCPDWGDPCKHVAATHYVLGEAFDRDPFLLFELRGRTRERVLAALRSARTGRESGAEDAPTPEEPSLSVTLDGIEPASYDRAPEPMPALSFSFEAENAQEAVLRQLGAPAAWAAGAAPADALAPILRAAAARARSLASAEAESALPAPDEERRAGAPPPQLARATPPRKSAKKPLAARKKTSSRAAKRRPAPKR